MKRFYNRSCQITKYTIALLMLVMSQGLYAQKVFVSEDVSNGYKSHDIIPCMIVMEHQWEAPDYIKSWTKEAKGDFVFDHLRALAEKDQLEIISYFDQENIDYQSFYIYNGLRAMLDHQQFLHLQNLPGIKFILLDQSSQLQVMDRGNSINRVEIEWGISRIQADKVWELGSLGKGIVVAGQDTGYDFDNPFISGNYRGNEGGTLDHNYNWHDAIHTLIPLNNDENDDPSNNPCGLDSNIPCDDHSHGTHTMGTMVGNDPDIKIGVAPEANWIGCRNMDRGWGSPSSYTECFEWFLAPTDLDGLFPDPSKSPHVINNSWGCPEIEGCNPENWMFMETVVKNLVASGIVVVVSAGNDGRQGCSSVNSPASIFDASFVVGASNILDSVAPFSSYGPVTVDGSGRLKPDVVAPGVNVRSIILEGFGTWSGTSMAGPHVAGTVALMIDANPNLAGRVEEIERILKETAVPVKDPRSCDGIVADQVPNFIAGYGRIDALAAVNEALVWKDSIDNKTDFFNIYPNPSTDFVSLIYSKDFRVPGVLQSYNMEGKLIWEADIVVGNATIDVRSWAAGIYTFVYRTNDDILRIGRFIKI